MERKPCRFPWRWLQTAGMGCEGRSGSCEFVLPRDGLGPADTDDGAGKCWQELHSTGRRGVVWLNGGSDCLKGAAGPSHLLRTKRGCGGGLDKHSTKKGCPAAITAEGMEGEAALEMAFIQQWGRGWLAQVEGQCPGGLLPVGGLRMVEGAETSSWQQTHKTASPGSSDHGLGVPSTSLLCSLTNTHLPHPTIFPYWSQVSSPISPYRTTCCWSQGGLLD